MATTTDNIKALELLKKKNEIDALTEEVKQLEMELGLRSYTADDVQAGPITLDFDRVVAVVDKNVRVDAAAALALAVEEYPLDQHPDLYKISVDTTVAKKVFSKEQYTSVQKNFAPKLTIRLK